MFSQLAMIIFEAESSYDISDETLVERIKAGDEFAFETLVGRMKYLIRAITTGYQYSDDYYQNGLILLYEACTKYDARRCDKFRPYYLQLLKYRLKDWQRAHAKIMHIQMISTDTDEEKDMLNNIPDRNPNPENVAVYNDLLKKVDPVTLQLSPLEYRLAKKLIDGYTLEEVVKEHPDKKQTLTNAYHRLKQKVILHLMR